MFFLKDLLVVRFLAPHVSHAVDEEGDVEGDGESHVEIDPKGVPYRFVPIVDWYSYRQKDVEYGEQWRIQPREGKLNNLVFNVLIYFNKKVFNLSSFLLTFSAT